MIQIIKKNVKKIFLVEIIIICFIFLYCYHRTKVEPNLENLPSNTPVTLPIVYKMHITQQHTLIPLTINKEKLIRLFQQFHTLSISSVSQTSPIISSANTQITAIGRCSYNGQSYVAGDIINTPQGWLRCSLTYVFLPPNTNLPQISVLAWIQVT